MHFWPHRPWSWTLWLWMHFESLTWSRPSEGSRLVSFYTNVKLPLYWASIRYWHKFENTRHDMFCLTVLPRGDSSEFRFLQMVQCWRLESKYAQCYSSPTCTPLKYHVKRQAVGTRKQTNTSWRRSAFRASENSTYTTLICYINRLVIRLFRPHPWRNFTHYHRIPETSLRQLLRYNQGAYTLLWAPWLREVAVEVLHTRRPFAWDTRVFCAQVGYHIYPPELKALKDAVKSAASHTYSCAPAPMQYAIAKGLNNNEECHEYILHTCRIMRAVGEFVHRSADSGSSASLKCSFSTFQEVSVPSANLNASLFYL